MHQLVKGEKLIIGGVEVPFPFGSLGHSDGDCLIHSIVDAVLGATALGDIGFLFPSTDEKYKDISSEYFLLNVNRRINDLGFKINNLDSTIIIQEPKLQKHIPKIKNNLIRSLQLEENQISVKATTTDSLGVVGEGRGWAAQAVVTILKKDVSFDN
tara:strand:+ start:53736 stop:54203 length:468 start_codon:yes stop_codon:yes gene_type:complete